MTRTVGSFCHWFLVGGLLKGLFREVVEGLAQVQVEGLAEELTEEVVEIPELAFLAPGNLL